MSKRILFIFISLAATLLQMQSARADYRITNASTTESAWVVHSTFRPAEGNWPAGWWTTGWLEIRPGTTQTLPIPAENNRLYILIVRGGKAIKPTDHANRKAFRFPIHPSKGVRFRVVLDNKGKILKSSHNTRTLKGATLYRYDNGGTYITPNDRPTRFSDRDVEQAHRIYNQAMDSVVLIRSDGRQGSGVLIDKIRRLVVTNQHVAGIDTEVSVYFPYRDQNGKLRKDLNFLRKNDYIAKGRVIAQNVRNDLTILRLDQVPRRTPEIKHNFNTNVEDSMRLDDIVYILGHPSGRPWILKMGRFVQPWEMCLSNGGDCLQLAAKAEKGNSGGPVLNEQGTLIGIISQGKDGRSLAAPARNVKALLQTVIANGLDPPQQTPPQGFKIRNPIGGRIHYQIKWSRFRAWQSYSLKTGILRTHSKVGNISSNYPKIRFDHITGDGRVTWKTKTLDIALLFGENNGGAPTYDFQFVAGRLFLNLSTAAAPALSKAFPEENALFANYPNPFNPETWIPYQLAIPADVTVAIYATDGTLIRTLDLGHHPAGVYQNKSRAAYWDGRNAIGEPVASGVYFYTITTGDYTATRKMLIRK